MYSGATVDSRRGPLIEGVEGFGDDFMLGRRSPAKLPTAVLEDVTKVLEQARQRLGPIRIEWAHDGKQVWVVQMHQAHIGAHGGVIYHGQRDNWLTFDPGDGLDALAHLIQQAKEAKAGIVVGGGVGVTSHVGDVLRKAHVPSRVVSPSFGLQERLFQLSVDD